VFAASNTLGDWLIGSVYRCSSDVSEMLRHISSCHCVWWDVQLQRQTISTKSHLYSARLYYVHNFFLFSCF